MLFFVLAQKAMDMLRPSWRTLVAFMLIFNALGAIPAGIMLLADPSGAKLGLDLGLLGHSPFTDYFWPGLLLLVFNGLLSLIALLFIWRGHRHALWLVTAQGAVLIVWILVQVLMLRTLHFFHVLMFGVGVALVIAVLLTRRDGRWFSGK